jgi:molybdopterin molybdotransferase
MAGVIPVADALAILRREIRPLDPEDVPLRRGLGRTLAREIVARDDFPHFDTTAMDGYAVRRAEGGAACRERPGVVAAGDPVPAPLAPGEALRVMTGAPLPPGAEAVVPVEEAVSEAGRLSWTKDPRPGAHVRLRGEIFRRGQTLAPAGARVSPEIVLLCATAGEDPVCVRRLPRAAVAPTGGEIVEPNAPLPEGRIRNGNGPALAAAFARRGIAARELPPCSDRDADLDRLFAEAREVDLLVTSGGVSAGDFDRTTEAAVRAGFALRFHGVAVKPGKPLAFGTRGAALWFGLPGNPVSALTTFEIFVVEALDLMAAAPSRRRFAPARLLAPLEHRGGREGLLDARAWLEDGTLVAEPLAGRGSHDVAAASRRNALLWVPAQGGSWPAGAHLPCLRLDDAAG